MIEPLTMPAILLALAISGAVIVAAELLRARPDRGRRKVMIGNAGATGGGGRRHCAFADAIRRIDSISGLRASSSQWTNLCSGVRCTLGQ